MNNFPVVDMLDGEADLGEPVQNLFLTEANAAAVFFLFDL